MIARSLVLLVELVALFAGVSFAVVLLQRGMGQDRIRAWMGGTPVVAALKGIAIGFVTPFCTYSAIPMLVGLRQAGVSPAGYVAFIAAAPVLDPVLFGALVLIVGVQAAMVYLAVAFVGALTLAMVAQRVGIARYLKPLPTAPATESLGFSSRSAVGVLAQPQAHIEQSWRGLETEARDAAVSSAMLLRSMGPLLLLGVAIGLGLESLVSPEVAARLTGDNSTVGIPVAAALGTPLYFNTELFVPIADSLKTAGVGIGAIVSLTIAGAGANLPEFVILSRLARKRLIAGFFVYVFGVAVVGGLLAQVMTG